MFGETAENGWVRRNAGGPTVRVRADYRLSAVQQAVYSCAQYTPGPVARVSVHW